MYCVSAVKLICSGLTNNTLSRGLPMSVCHSRSACCWGWARLLARVVLWALCSCHLSLATVAFSALMASVSWNWSL